MSGGKHTPGPWLVSRDHLCDTLVRAKDAASGQRIASTFVSHATQANAETRLARIRENEANARLIAAAPDLLEALKQAQAHWHHMIGMSSPTEHHRLNEKMLAAISRASGESQ